MKPLFCVQFLLLVVALSPDLQAQPLLHLDPSPAPNRLAVTGVPGNSYRLEACPEARQTGPWEFLATLSLTDSSGSWLDARSATEPRRFYRAIDLGPWEPVRAEDFRLIDQQGRSRWLFYHL